MTIISISCICLIVYISSAAIKHLTLHKIQDLELIEGTTPAFSRLVGLSSLVPASVSMMSWWNHFQSRHSWKASKGSNLWKFSGTTPVSFGLDAVLLVRVSRVASLVNRGIWFKILALSNDSQWLSMTHAFTVFSRLFWQPSRCSLLSTLWCKAWSGMRLQLSVAISLDWVQECSTVVCPKAGFLRICCAVGRLDGRSCRIPSGRAPDWRI